MKNPSEFYVPRNTNTSKCRSCGAEVKWIVTTTGKRMPLSVRTERVDENGEHVAQSHFADCPNAQQHRKPKSGGGAS